MENQMPDQKKDANNSKQDTEENTFPPFPEKLKNVFIVFPGQDKALLLKNATVQYHDAPMIVPASSINETQKQIMENETNKLNKDNLFAEPRITEGNSGNNLQFNYIPSFYNGNVQQMLYNSPLSSAMLQPNILQLQQAMMFGGIMQTNPALASLVLNQANILNMDIMNGQRMQSNNETSSVQNAKNGSREKEEGEGISKSLLDLCGSFSSSTESMVKEDVDQKRKREYETMREDQTEKGKEGKCAKNGFKVGDVVMARYCTLHDQEYKATVSSADILGDVYSVEWEDGDKTNKKKTASEMRIWADENIGEKEFKIGDNVLAKYSQNGFLYNAVIVGIKSEEGKIKIKWCDGDKKDRIKNKYQLFFTSDEVEKKGENKHPSVGGLTLR
eukprot:3933992-Rhodomonas_salina.2